ncbi:hypothetical protein [Pararhizobium sp. O133]|uniref:hypothetical protein n=1 Tax=Pararhizobium sp. O133 TaxID=3449278 RepID=UPI003F6851B5
MSEKMKGPLEEYPTEDKRSFGYEVARTAIDAATSIIPGGSYAAGAIVQRFVAAPLEKRRDEWFQRLGKGLRELEDRLEGFDPHDLESNDDFVSAVYEATQASMKTSREEKLEYLRNAVLNIATGYEIEETLRGVFFSYLDQFSPAHIKVLTLLADPTASPEMVAAAKTMYAGSQMAVLEAALPESVMPKPVMQRVFRDLDREGLADTGGMVAMGTSAVFLAKRSTTVGDEFLRFIATPL